MNSGAQSILVKNISNSQQDFDNKILSLGNNFTIYKRFMIGEKMDYDKMMFVKSFHKLLCTNNCEIINFIDKKIKGKLKECGVKHKKKPTISDLFKIYQQQVENCSITQVTEDCCDWEKIEW